METQQPQGLWKRFLHWLGVNGNGNGHSATHDEKENRGRRQARNGKSRRPFQRVEVTSPRLYVGNLSYDATESDLFDLFRGVGSVQNAEVVSNRRTQRSKGFAFVQMQSIDEAKRAVDELHDKEFMGRKLVVSGAKEMSASN